jgi:hypothetical protein
MATAVRPPQVTWSAPYELDEMLEALSGQRLEEQEALLDLTEGTETIVLSICGRDRRLRIR